MCRREFAGVFPYLVSPIDSQGEVKEEVLKSLVEHLIRCGVHGLTPLGSTGEFAYLTWPQRRRMVEVVLEAAGGRIPVVAGIAHTSIREAVRQAVEMEAIGADGILAIMDLYFPVSQEGVVSYFRSIAEAVSCPIVLYTNPSFSSGNLSPEAISVDLYELARMRKWDQALLLQRSLWDINRIFQKYALAACIKACLEVQGFPVGPPIPPLQPLSGSAMKEVEEVLRGLEAT